MEGQTAQNYCHIHDLGHGFNISQARLDCEDGSLLVYKVHYAPGGGSRSVALYCQNAQVTGVYGTPFSSRPGLLKKV